PGQFAPFPNIGNPPPDCSTNTFGLAFSCDGIHPSAATHRLIARKLVRAINQKYGSAIPAVPRARTPLVRRGSEHGIRHSAGAVLLMRTLRTARSLICPALTDRASLEEQ